MSHSILPPSSAGVWSQCAGSVLMATLYPEQETDDTRVGDAAHWVVAESLMSFKNYEGGINLPPSFVGKEAPNSVIVTEEMTDAAHVMVDDVLEVCQQHGLMRALHIEEQMEFPSIHLQQFGTPDCWAHDEDTNDYFLWDFKYGHLNVPPDSWQNKNYAAGIMAGSMPEDRIRMTIVQPRSYHEDGPVKSVSTSSGELRGDWNRLESQAALAMTADPPLVSGPHCRYCPARHGCPAARKAAATVIDYVEQTTVPDNLSDEGLAFELALLERAGEMLKHRHTALQEEAIRRIHDGQAVPGYGIKRGQGNRIWNVAPEEVKGLAGLFDLGDVEKPAELITPAKFDERIKVANRTRIGENKIDTRILEAYTQRPDSGLKLVHSTDTVAAQVFTKK